MNQINILLLLLFFLSSQSFGQVKQVNINGTSFEIRSFEENDLEQIEYIEVFRNNKKLLSHTMAEFDGDCSSENIELGGYEIIDSNIIFYSYWAGGDRMGKNIYPFGFRKQTYVVKEDGTLSLLSSEIYMENYVDSWSEHEGMKYLHQQALTATEKELLQDYISAIEEIYSSTFVVGESKIALGKYVKNKLRESIIENTNHWQEVYGENCRM